MPARNALRRLILLITMTATTATVAATATWLALRSDPDPDQLAEMSAIGEAFGTISAALSAIALIGIATSLYFQMQQTRVAQIEASRTMRAQLMQFALTNPQYLPLWGFDPREGEQKNSEAAYNSLVFAYLKMSYALRVLTDFELAGWCRVAFQQRTVANFWNGAREVYLRDTSSSGARRFARLIDSVYAETNRPDSVADSETSRSSTEVVRPRPASPGGGRRPTAAIAFAIGLAVGIGFRAIAKRQTSRSP